MAAKESDWKSADTMRVLHITHLYPRPHDHLLGIAMHKQILALKAQSCIPKVLSPTAWAPFPLSYLSHKWKSYSQVPACDIIDGVEVYYPRYLALPRAFLLATSGLRMHRGILRLVEEISQEFSFDLIHAHMALPDGYAGMLISEKYRKPLVVTFQATDLDITANRSRSCFLALQKVFSHAKQVIAPSPRLAKQLASRFGIKPVVICYGIDPDEIFISKKSLASHQGSAILLSVSRFIPTKGIDLNVRAVKQLVKRHKNLMYLIVGDGPQRPALERLTHDLSLRNHVEFVGQVSHKRAMEYMAMCDIFSMPSWQETFGLVYLEAMAHGKPVVAVQGQGVDGIVTHGETGILVKPRDIDTLVEALDFLLSHPEEAKAIGERSRNMVLKNYTWEKNAKRTIEVYHEVLNGR